MQPILQGIVLGTTLSALVGPALFALLQTSVHSGVRAGLLLAFGIFLSDASIVALSYLGILELVQTGNHFVYIATIGGLILIASGISTFKKKTVTSARTKTGTSRIIETESSRPLTYIGKGLILNFMNPYIWLFWISVMVTVSSGANGKRSDVLFFFMGALLTILFFDAIKVFVAHQLKSKLNDKLLYQINHIVGVILVIFGLALIARAWFFPH